MGRFRKNYYDADFLKSQLKYYEGLSEKHRRHFLAMEYKRLGVGSQRYLSDVFGCARDTIRKGLKEIDSSDFKPDYSRERKAGGGRKKRANHP